MSRYINSVPQILDGNGDPIVGAKKVMYTPGTTNLKTIYSDSTLITPRTNPVTADASGRFPEFFLDGLYDEVQQDASGTVDTDDGATIWTRDNVGDVSTGPFILWDTGVIYSIPEIVLGSDDEYYRSLVDSNQGNDPISSAAQWDQLSFGRIWNINITYAIGESVYGSDGHLYVARVSQSGNDPTGDGTNWYGNLKRKAVSSGVNELVAVDATTGNSPALQSSGEADIGIDFENSEGEKLLELVATPTAANNVRITNATTGNAAKIDASETNSDLDFPRNGTGEITVDSTPIYGLVVLGTPVLLATDTTTTATGNTPVDITAQTTGVAVKAILNVFIDATGAGGTSASEVLVGEGDETLTTLIHRAVFARYNAIADSDSNQVTVNLAAGEIFDYEILQTGTAPASRTVEIYLAGYYI